MRQAEHDVIEHGEEAYTDGEGALLILPGQEATVTGPALGDPLGDES